MQLNDVCPGALLYSRLTPILNDVTVGQAHCALNTAKIDMKNWMREWTVILSLHIFLAASTSAGNRVSEHKI